MIKKTITYHDFDGNEIVEDFYFNLSKAEIAEMELSQEGGLSGYLQEIVKTSDGSKIIGAFKDILSRSYGRRSEDGKRFIKSPEITAEFMQTDAYSELFMELVTNADKSAEFIRGIVPSNLAAQIEETPGIETVKPPKEKKLTEMTREELLAAMQAKNAEVVKRGG